MNAQQKQRLSELKDPYASYELVDALYGLGSRPAEDVMGRFRVWARRFTAQVEPERNGRIHRFLLETFFQRTKLIPRKWAALRLGMTDGSWTAVKAALFSDGLITPEELEPLTDLVREPLIHNFHEFFSDTRLKTFANNTDRCRLIHDAIDKSYDIQVVPQYCVTSQTLQESPLLFGEDFDVITGDPVSVRYCVWLNTGKPNILHPDVCSLKLYVAELAELKDMAFSGAEQVEEQFQSLFPQLSRAA